MGRQTSTLGNFYSFQLFGFLIFGAGEDIKGVKHGPAISIGHEYLSFPCLNQTPMLT